MATFRVPVEGTGIANVAVAGFDVEATTARAQDAVRPERRRFTERLEETVQSDSSKGDEHMTEHIEKTLLTVAVVLATAVSGIAETTHVINSTKYSAATRITSAIDWNERDNWDAAGVPNSSDSFASISASLPANTYAYVTSAVPITLSRVAPCRVTRPACR